MKEDKRRKRVVKKYVTPALRPGVGLHPKQRHNKQRR